MSAAVMPPSQTAHLKTVQSTGLSERFLRLP